MTKIPGIPRIANGQAATSRMETLRYNYLCQHIQWPAIVDPNIHRSGPIVCANHLATTTFNQPHVCKGKVYELFGY